MKFQRLERYTPVEMTSRRIGAFQRKQAKEQQRYPLFSSHVAMEQRSLDDEVTRRQAASDAMEKSLRELEARVWRKARAAYFAAPDLIRAAIRSKWAIWPGPRRASSFLYCVEVENGALAARSEKARAHDREIAEAIRSRLAAQEHLPL